MCLSRSSSRILESGLRQCLAIRFWLSEATAANERATECEGEFDGVNRIGWHGTSSSPSHMTAPTAPRTCDKD
jgi:hypothetical protein